MLRVQIIIPAALTSIILSIPAAAQTSSTPAAFTGSISAGLALTGGNTDTSNFNIGFTLLRDLKTRNIIKANGLYLRAGENGALNVDRTSVNLRDEYTVSNRTFVFGQTDYFRDRFKEVSYLFAPTAGAGYNLLKTDNTLLLFDGGLGGFWEKDFNTSLKTSGSVTAGERFTRKVSPAVSLTQSLTGLWKMDDFADSLSNFSAGVATSITRRLELKVEFLDSYKNRPARIGIRKNDTAFVTALVVKF